MPNISYIEDMPINIWHTEGSTFDRKYELKGEVLDWLREQKIEYRLFIHRGVIYMPQEKDLMHFKLVWG